MESSSNRELEALRRIDETRERAAGAPRAYAGLLLGYAVLLAAYVGVFAFTGSDIAGATVFGNSTMALVLPPILISTSLLQGLSERFQGRLHSSRRQRIVLIVFVALLVALLAWGIVGGGYPWWIAVIAAIVTLLAFGIRPLTLRLHTPAVAADAEPWRRGPLSRSARISTVAIGVLLGLPAAFIWQPTAVWFAMMLVMVAFLLFSSSAVPGGLPRTGYEWGIAQCVAFVLTALVLFALAVMVILTDGATPAIAITAGVVAAAPIIVSAFIPRRGHGASEA